MTVLACPILAYPIMRLSAPHGHPDAPQRSARRAERQALPAGRGFPARAWRDRWLECSVAHPPPLLAIRARRRSRSVIEELELRVAPGCSLPRRRGPCRPPPRAQACHGPPPPTAGPRTPAYGVGLGGALQPEARTGTGCPLARVIPGPGVSWPRRLLVSSPSHRPRPPDTWRKGQRRCRGDPDARAWGGRTGRTILPTRRWLSLSLSVTVALSISISLA